MSDGSNKLNPSAAGIDVCVAMIGRDESGDLILTACNVAFFKTMQSPSANGKNFPIPIDDVVPDALRKSFRQNLLESFEAERNDLPERFHDFSIDSQCWRFTFSPIRHAGADATVREILLTGVEIAGAAVPSVPTNPTQAPEFNTSRYRALVDLAYDAIVTMDERHNITLFNRAAENLFGYTAAEVLGRPIVTLLPKKLRAGHPEKVRKFSETYQPTVRQATPPKMDDTNSVYGQHRNGSVIPVEISVSKIELNGAIEFMAVVRDITDRARLMELLKKQAGTDALTGLPNRRECTEFLEKALASDAGLSVFILDIDFFKDINDRYGHDAGDEVLRVLAKVGASMTEGPNLFARWGGEEFVAALPGADAHLALTIADQIRLRYERQDFEHAWRQTPIPFTVSIGVVTREAGERDVDALMKRADRALYRAKKSGRNRVEVG